MTSPLMMLMITYTHQHQLVVSRTSMSPLIIRSLYYNALTLTTPEDKINDKASFRKYSQIIYDYSPIVSE